MVWLTKNIYILINVNSVGGNSRIYGLWGLICDFVLKDLRTSGKSRLKSVRNIKNKTSI